MDLNTLLKCNLFLSIAKNQFDANVTMHINLDVFDVGEMLRKLKNLIIFGFECILQPIGVASCTNYVEQFFNKSPFC